MLQAVFSSVTLRSIFLTTLTVQLASFIVFESAYDMATDKKRLRAGAEAIAKSYGNTEIFTDEVDTTESIILFTLEAHLSDGLLTLLHNGLYS